MYRWMWICNIGICELSRNKFYKTDNEIIKCTGSVFIEDIYKILFSYRQLATAPKNHFVLFMRKSKYFGNHILVTKS